METTTPKRPMPRTRLRGGRDRAHAARQRAYRERLATAAIPEADDVDAAVLGVIRVILAWSEKKEREGRGHPAEVAFSTRVIKNSIAALVNAGFDADASEALVRYRLGDRKQARPRLAPAPVPVAD